MTENLESANCPYCGAKVILDWEGQVGLAAHLELGQSFLQYGNYEEADAHFSRALEKNRRSGDAWFWKGIVVIMQDRLNFSEGDGYWRRSTFTTEETIDRLGDLLSDVAYPDRRVPFLISRAMEAAWLFHFFHWAEMLLEVALRVHPGAKSDIAASLKYNLQGYVGIAWYAGGAGEFEQAESYLKRALEIDPSKSRAVAGKRIDLPAPDSYAAWPEKGFTGYVGLAWYAGRAGEFERAESYLKRALQIESEKRSAVSGCLATFEGRYKGYTGYIGLAEEARQSKQFDRATRYLERGLQIDPGNMHQVMGQNYSYRHRDMDSDSKRLGGCLGLAKEMAKAGRLEEAASFFERMLEIEPRLPMSDSYMRLARWAGQSGSPNLAKTYLKRAIALDASVKQEAKEVAKELGVRLGWF